MAKPPTGLRERKRVATRRRLEEAAVHLVLQDGPDQATVEAISQVADVSPRTFFNYFDSKDSAILGLQHVDTQDPRVVEEALRVGDGDLVATAIHLILSAVDSPWGRATLRADREEIIQRHPELLRSKLALVTELTSSFATILQNAMASHSGFLDQDPDDGAAAADVILALCTGAVRRAIREQAQADSGLDETDLHHRAHALTTDTLERLR